MTDLSIFSANTGLTNNPLFQELQGLNDKLAGGEGGTYRRISIKGGKFRQMVGGEQISVTREAELGIVIIDAAPIARTYYAKSYDPATATAPTCWSSDTKTPDASVPEESRQASKCDDCPMAIKGSGQGESRACRFSQRLAVVLEGALEEVYQLQLPATSVFGDVKNNRMPMQAYGKFLKAHKAPAIAVYTDMYFDDESESPKLFFKANRPLTEEELETVAALRDTEAVSNALNMTVAATEGVVAEKPKQLETKPVPEKKEARKEVPLEDDAPIAEPERVKSKAETKTANDVPDDLGGIIDEWDD